MSSTSPPRLIKRHSQDWWRQGWPLPTLEWCPWMPSRSAPKRQEFTPSLRMYPTINMLARQADSLGGSTIQAERNQLPNCVGIDDCQGDVGGQKIQPEEGRVTLNWVGVAAHQTSKWMNAYGYRDHVWVSSFRHPTMPFWSSWTATRPSRCKYWINVFML